MNCLVGEPAVGELGVGELSVGEQSATRFKVHSLCENFELLRGFVISSFTLESLVLRQRF